MNKIILFDLDSTLLQMDQNKFLEAYFKSIAVKAKSLGYEIKSFMDIFMASAYAIVGNDGNMTNEELFWKGMSRKYNEIDFLKKEFSDYYQNEFPKISYLVQKGTTSKEIIEELKKKGYILILATNPLFPKECTEERMRWAGLKPDDFFYVTTYENSHYCKPNALYYQEIFQKLGLNMQDSIMVGNDLSDDFSQLPQEMRGILITDYLINTKNMEITIPAYTLKDFLDEIKENW